MASIVGTADFLNRLEWFRWEESGTLQKGIASHSSQYSKKDRKFTSIVIDTSTYDIFHGFRSIGHHFNRPSDLTQIKDDTDLPASIRAISVVPGDTL